MHYCVSTIFLGFFLPLALHIFPHFVIFFFCDISQHISRENTKKKRISNSFSKHVHLIRVLASAEKENSKPVDQPNCSNGLENFPFVRDLGSIFSILNARSEKYDRNFLSHQPCVKIRFPRVFSFIITPIDIAILIGQSKMQRHKNKKKLLAFVT